MKKLNKIFKIALISILTLSLIAPMNAQAATTPSLGQATIYGVLSSTYTETSSATTINGSVGFTTPPATPPLGTHPFYGSVPPYAMAGSDQGTALASLGLEPCTFSFAPGAIDLSTDITHGPAGIFTPGVYCSVGAMNISGPLLLDGNGTYIFRAVGALTSAAGAVVTLNNASACDVFWTPTQATTLAANTTFIGTVIDDAGITVGANTTWSGRALAYGGTVTTDTNTITVPICAPATANLRIVKQVVNNSTGTSTPSAFSLSVKLANVNVAGSPAFGTSTPGTLYSLLPNTYTISEGNYPGYAQSFSGDCDINGNITLIAGDNKTCTVTNDDITPTSTITVVKTVVNDSGGTKVISDFPLFINNTPVTSGVTNDLVSPAAYTITETNNSQYTQEFSGDCDANGLINLGVGENKTCIITNNDIQPASSGGGGSGYSGLIVSPQINVVKVPSPLSLPLGPGLVKYSFAVTNPGTIAVENVTLTDNSCSPLTFISGDVNSNAKLDINEIWNYTCSTTLQATHTNTAVATGWANNISAVDIATATVVVGAPLTPPLINLTKSPYPLKLPAKGGQVTYTEKISNPGLVALSNVKLTDDKCSPLKYISGDVNKDSKLDTTETWTYTCSTTLTKTTTNTAVASGEANNITIRDYALATVIVATSATNVPKLPNAGVPPTTNLPQLILNISLLALVITTSSYLILKNKNHKS